MKLAPNDPRPATLSVPREEAALACATRPMGADRKLHWQRWLAVGMAGVLLNLPVQAKPISGCLVQEADLLDPTSCLAPPESLTSTRPTSYTNAAVGADKVSRVTLDNIDSGSGSVNENQGGAPADFANCSALRGTHEAQSLMLQTVQTQLISVERSRNVASNTLRSLRSSGANEAQLTSAAARLTQINAVWSAMRGDVAKRTKNFNRSMSKLTKACIRG